MSAGIIQADCVNTPVRILRGPTIALVHLDFGWHMMGSIVKVPSLVLL